MAECPKTEPNIERLGWDSKIHKEQYFISTTASGSIQKHASEIELPVLMMILTELFVHGGHLTVSCPPFMGSPAAPEFYQTKFPES